MDDWTFLVTLVCLYASFCWVFRLPNVLSCFQRLAAVTCTRPPADSEETRSRLREYRQKNLPDWVPVFIKTGEAYGAVLTALRLAIPGAWTKPAWQDLHMWSLMIALVGLRWSCTNTSLWQRRFISMLFSMASMMSQVDMPKQLGHVNGVAYAAISLFIGDPWFGVGALAVCSPMRVVLTYGQSWSLDQSAATLDLVMYMTNDLLTCVFTFLILHHSDALMCKVLQTAIDLEEQVRQKERGIQETEDLLSAARRLLSVTCDCCEQLTDRFEVVQPSQNALALLQIRNPEEESQLESGTSLPLLQFICPDDHDRFTSFVGASHDAPSSLHLRMQTCRGASFEAQLFHVKVPGTLRQPQHLIGIKSAAAEMMMSIPEHCVVEASPFVPSIPRAARGARSQRSQRSNSSAGSSSSGGSEASGASACTDPRNLEIDHISFEVDPANECSIVSVQAAFSGSRTTMTKWIRGKSEEVVGLIQHHMNSWHHGERSTQTCRRVKFKIPGFHAAFTAGEVSVASIHEVASDQDYPSSMKVQLRSITFR